MCSEIKCGYFLYECGLKSVRYRHAIIMNILSLSTARIENKLNRQQPELQCNG